MFDDLDLDLPPLDLPVDNPVALMATPTTHLWPIAFIRDLALGLTPKKISLNDIAYRRMTTTES